jgi:hypothetical protein
MDCNQALRRVTSQLKTLTEVVDRHSDFLTSHEKRLQRLEKYLKAKGTELPGLPDLKAEDH